MSSASVRVRRKRTFVKYCGENEPGVKLRFGASSEALAVALLLGFVSRIVVSSLSPR